MTVVDGEIISSYGFFDASSKNEVMTKGWWNRWGGCVGTVLRKMTDGSVGGSIAGLACIAFGPQCAAGVGLGCAGNATFS